MRRVRASRRYRVVGLLAALGLIVGASATPAAADRTGFASSNVEWVATIPLDTGSPTGARLLDDYFYVGGAKSLSIYDVTDRTLPILVSHTPIGVQFANEDMDTNGKILLMSDDTLQGGLHVWDVEDKTAPVRVSILPGLRDHTFACVFDCSYAYGARGAIVDLRDPARPQLVGNWAPGMGAGQGFDTTEVAPGVVLTASRVMKLLDGRKDPANPTERAQGTTLDNRIIHSSKWPRKGKDRFILVQGETPFTGRCNNNSGAFMTWDASKYKKTHTFTPIDEFRVTNGNYADGNPPAGAVGCTNLWFTAHPKFRNGGLVAAAFAEHGTRFLKVDKKGLVTEAGYFTPIGGSTFASYWVSNELVYSIDVTRGLDILRYNAGA